MSNKLLLLVVFSAVFSMLAFSNVVEIRKISDDTRQPLVVKRIHMPDYATVVGLKYEISRMDDFGRPPVHRQALLYNGIDMKDSHFVPQSSHISTVTIDLYESAIIDIIKNSIFESNVQ